MCNCCIICHCSDDIFSSSPLTVSIDTSNGPQGAWLLGKTRTPDNSIERDTYKLFDVKNDYKSYAYTLSPRTVGIMNNKSRDAQYKTLKRLHTDALNEFKCSYILNIEVYPNNDNDLHVHGLIRFLSHSDKEKFKKLIKQRITLGKKGTYNNLIDCEFVNDFQAWDDYINKAQDKMIDYKYFPIYHIDYSFHIGSLIEPKTITVPVCGKKRKVKLDNLEAQLLKAQQRVDKLNAQLLSYKTLNNNICL